jgi:hypothetical protein
MRHVGRPRTGPMGPSTRLMLLLSDGLIVAATAVSLSLPSAFRPYFGDLDPILATAIAVAVAAGSLAYLTSRGVLTGEGEPASAGEEPRRGGSRARESHGVIVSESHRSVVRGYH